MSDKCHGVPFWPEDSTNEPRRMQFCQGEPGWYFWIRSIESQSLLILRRDLLMLHRNGDLKQLKQKTLPPFGTFITAWDEEKMIRGLVLSPDASICKTDQTNRLAVHVLDVDEGTKLWIPLHQIRQLPDSMMALPAQAVRVDLGLECQEHFKWPSELNGMLQRGLEQTILYVNNVTKRPGSIPTISADIDIFFSSIGRTVNLKKWLIEEFSNHLKICGMDVYKPFPIGLSTCKQHLTIGNAVMNPEQPQPAPPTPIPLDMMQILGHQFQSMNLQPPLPYYLPFNGISQCPPVTPPGFSWPSNSLISTMSASSVSSCNEECTPQNLQTSVESLVSEAESSSSAAITNSSVIDLSVHSNSGDENDVRADALSPLPKACQVQNEDQLLTSSINRSKVGNASHSERKTHQSPPPKGKYIALQEIVYDWSPGTVVTALVAYCYDPQAFEVNVVDDNCKLLEQIREEMLHFYKNVHISLDTKARAKAACGDYCGCYDPIGKFWFRSEIINWKLDKPTDPISVWSVDDGGTTEVDLKNIQPLSSPLAMTSPRLATLCSMKNVRPRGNMSSWPEADKERFKQLMPIESIVYLRIDGKKGMSGWPVSVFKDAACSMESVNEILVAEQCAHYFDPSADAENQRSEYCDLDSNPMEEAYKIGGNNYSVDDEDALVAVTGHHSNDEVGICWAFQRAGGFCYKKYCTQRHVLLDPDGITLEKEEVHTTAFNDLNEPEPNNVIRLSISKILKVDHFIAQMKSEKKQFGNQSLASILQSLNSTETKRSLKAFSVLPAIGELVIAKDKHGKLFRGRIRDVDFEDENKYQVFNVDDGHVQWVSLENLRKMDPGYLHHPFQAVECWLYNVVPTNETKEWTMTCNSIFAELVRGKTLTAKVIKSSSLGLEVVLFDTDGRDIAKTLIAEGILKQSPVRHLPSSNVNFVPG